MSPVSGFTILKNPLTKRIELNFSRKQMKWVKILLILAGSLIIGCGGGGIDDLASSGGGIGGSGVNGGGTGGTGISSGSVTAIGSVHVNGVRYDTSDAEIFVEGQSKGFGDTAVLANLKVGMVVRVEGDIEDDENGTADRVYFNDDLRGPVTSIDSLPTAITVLNKEVVILDYTRIDGLDLGALTVDEWVQVSGFEDADGRIRASFITGSAPTEKASFRGIITGLNTLQSEFQMNGITIDYHTAEFSGFTEPTDGLWVKVTGILSPDYSRLTAEKIERVDLLGVTDAEEVELEGIITEKASYTQLSLGGVPVVLDALTDFSGGDPSELEVGLWVEIEGELSAGILYASRVIFQNDLKVEAQVEINNGSEITVDGLPSLTIGYSNAVTKVTGDANSPAEITAIHYIKVLGRQTGPDTLEAIHIIVKDTLNDTVKLQGTLEDDTPPIVTVLDQEIDLDSIPDENFESPEGVSVTQSEFENRIASGDADFISVKGELDGFGSVIWLSISAE